MPDLFSKVSELLSNPESAQKIRQIASTLSSSEGEPMEESEAQPLPSDGSPEPDVMSMLSGFSGGGGAHSREMALLNAVRPYLRSSRAGKIDRAMNAIRVIDMLSNLR